MRSTGRIRQRTPGSWEVRYNLGTDAATGKRRVATITVQGNRRDAEKELRRLLRTLDTGEHVDPTRMTVREWLVGWLDAVRGEISPKSHERYSEIVENFLMPAMGNLPLVKLAPSHIQQAYNAWVKGGRRDGKDGGLSASTRRYIHTILKSALGRAVEQQVLVRNPADAFKRRLPKLERKEIVTLTAEESRHGGVHPKVAQERLGHSTITTTMDLYSHVTDNMQADAAQRLDAAFRAAETGLEAKNRSVR